MYSANINTSWLLDICYLVCEYIIKYNKKKDKRMKNKRIILILLVMMSVFALVCGCGEVKEVEEKRQKKEGKKEIAEESKAKENVEEKKTIRVILQSDSLDYEHKEVCLTSDDDFCVQQGESTREYTKGETAKFWPENFDDEFSTIKIETKNPEGTLRLKSLKRDYDMPEYKGILWIYRRFLLQTSYRYGYFKAV